MKKFLFLFLFPALSYCQSVISTKEMEDNVIIIAPQSAYIRGTTSPNGSVKLKKIRIDSLMALSAKGVSALVANKADLSYVNTRFASIGTGQANAKIDSVRAKFLISLKADITALNSKVETSTFNTALSAKANSSDLSLKENTVDVNAKLGFKAPVLNPNFQGDVELSTIGNGVIIKSPNGTRFRLTVSNTGDIIATSL